MQDALPALKEILKGGTVSYQAIFAKSLKSVPSAVFLSQAYFWQENALYRKEDEHRFFGDVEYFSKTAIDWYDATGLSDEQQKTARERLVSVGILSEIKAGIPARLWFRIDLHAIVSVVTSFLDTRNQVSGKHGNSAPGNTETVRRETRKQCAGKHGDNIESSREFDDSFDSEKREDGGFDPFKNFSTFAAAPETNTPPSSAAPPRAAFENQAAFTVATYEQAETPTGPVFVEMHGEATRVPLATRTPKAKSKKAPTKITPAEITPEQIAAHLQPSEQGFFAQVIANGAWKDWTDYRMERDRFTYKSAKSAAAGVRCMIECTEANADIAQSVVDKSRANNWQGIFPIKSRNNNARQQHQSGNNSTSDFYGGAPGSFTGGIRRD